ncbi:MAG TPA: alpha-(1-_3)-arabinofuranosyltransferase family protein, partial [Ilumatobacteraceae bacterium]|nr:alpha-(1->3)-arabinofuranosyltransferase family protein [Ilumatobacteraceae bacterium]
GQEFGAFRWGYTSDPPLPGLTDRPLVTRDLLPLGSAPAMDLLYAFDDRFQDGTAEAASVAAIARLFAADTIWLPNDVAFDRYRTPRPELTAALFAATGADSGLGDAIGVGTPQPNTPVLAMVDEDSLSNPSIGQPLAPVELITVTDPVPIVRAKSEVVMLAGSGDGVVDAERWLYWSGTKKLLRYTADASVTADDIAAADRVIVTDSNRDRAHHWHSSQDVWGFTEDGADGQGVLVDSTDDERIPVFSPDEPADRTAADQRGGTRAAASAYGEPFAYRPESRAAMAVDGDLATAWVVADRWNPVGEFITVEADDAFPTVTLVQPHDARNRWITAVTMTTGGDTGADVGAGGEPFTVALDASSHTPQGQVITLPRPSASVTITIAAIEHHPAASLAGLDAVGFAEVTTAAGPSEEVVRVPSNVLPAVGADQPLDVVLTRLRTRATNRWRADPE